MKRVKNDQKIILTLLWLCSLYLSLGNAQSTTTIDTETEEPNPDPFDPLKPIDIAGRVCECFNF